MIYANVSRSGAETIIYLDTAQTQTFENLLITSVEAFHALIAERQVAAVMFGLYGLPRRTVPVGPQADKHFATMLRKVG